MTQTFVVECVRTYKECSYSMAGLVRRKEANWDAFDEDKQGPALKCIICSNAQSYPHLHVFVNEAITNPDARWSHVYCSEECAIQGLNKQGIGSYPSPVEWASNLFWPRSDGNPTQKRVPWG